MQNFTPAIQNINDEYRHLIGGYAIGLSELEENIKKIIEKAESLLKLNKKVIVAIPYHQLYENSYAYLLKLLAGRLIITGNRNTSLIFPQTDLDISRKLSGNNSPGSFSETEFLLIHNLPQHRNLINYLETESKTNQVIIATGLEKHWENITSKIPIVFYSEPFNFRQGFDLEEIEQAFQETIENDLQEFQNLSDWQKEAVFITSSFDSLGVPLPFDLLASLLEVDEGELGKFIEDENFSFLYETEADFPPTYLVTTKSPAIAKELLKKNVSDISKKLTENYLSVIDSVEPENKDERYTILNLFQNALLGYSYKEKELFPSRADWRDLIKKSLAKLREIWSAGDEIEHLLWGKVLEDFQLFEFSAEVFSEGLRSNINNPYLLQAEARMYGNWALIEPEKMGKAEELFRELTDSTAENPYFLQAQGVFEASRQNPHPQKARTHFRDALNVAQGEEVKTYILTAWANLEIEQGNFDFAEELLGEIISDSKSPYLLHIQAKLNFYRGDYEKALEKLKQILAARPYSIESWNLIGEIASKRGHWQQAITAFQKALEVNAENVPTLRSLGDLEADLGRIAGSENIEEAQKHFDNAKGFFNKALEVEPENFFVKVSHNVLLRYKGSLLKTLNKNDEVEKLFAESEKSLRKLQKKFTENNFVTHNIGELFQAKEEFDTAQQYFEYLRKENKSVPNLTGLAKAELKLGNIDKTMQLLREAEQVLDSSNQKHFERIRSLNSLAETWLDLNDLEKADKLVQAAFELDKENVFTLRIFSHIKQMLERKEDAELLEKEAKKLTERELENFLTEKK